MASRRRARNPEHENVMIAIRGMQFFTGEADSDEIETVNRGYFYRENGGIVLEFDELYEDTTERTHTRLRIRDGELLLTRTGFISVEMDFTKGKKSLSLYQLPFGEILLGIDTKSVIIEESPEEILIRADYSMEINYQFLTDSSLKISVKPVLF